MKIDSPNPVRGTAPTKKKETAGAATPADFFSLVSADQVAGAAGSKPIADIQPPTSLDTLLTLQEMPDDERRDREAYQHSKGAVETLEKLRDALLMDHIPRHLLGELQEVVHRQRLQVKDPHLRAIMQDIELRASVELAKIERAKVGEN